MLCSIHINGFECHLKCTYRGESIAWKLTSIDWFWAIESGWKEWKESKKTGFQPLKSTISRFQNVKSMEDKFKTNFQMLWVCGCAIAFLYAPLIFHCISLSRWREAKRNGILKHQNVWWLHTTEGGWHRKISCQKVQIPNKYCTQENARMAREWERERESDCYFSVLRFSTLQTYSNIAIEQAWATIDRR